VNRLQDLGYRVRTLDTPALLQRTAVEEKPLVVLADLSFRNGGVCEAIVQLKESPVTRHLPVLAFAGERDAELLTMARQAGARLTVHESALLVHLPQFLDQTLEID
jgi:CheY-like chemotaxis protein